MPKKTLKTTKNSKHLKKRALLPARVPTTNEDIKTAVLLVSLTINVAIFIAWLLLRLTTDYDAQVYNFLFSR